MFRKRKKKKEEKAEMSFLEHLDELRRRIIYSLIGIAVGCAVVGYKIDFVIEKILLAPALKVGLKLQNLQPFGQPFLYFKVLLIGGLIIALPFVLFQLWKFVAPGLYPNEKKWVRLITFFTTFCFVAGVVFSYYIMIPFMLNFSAYFGTQMIENKFDINYYFGFVSMMVLASGLVFEMPMISFVLSRFGLLTAKFLRKYRRHSIIVILILAAILTPTPDPVNQLVFALPLFILYEISIWVVAATERRSKRINDEANLESMNENNKL
ncbi:MAG: twin-arginine translocase subunit TatC [Ignavibacteria bacterium]|nr:twin-arginine translocase subunit TatC [Ignavibacteria bacterium]